MKYWTSLRSNRVTHRELGHIPGCRLAPRNSTFVAISLEDAQKETARHADAFCKALEDGSYKTFSFPMLGVYGERL